MADLKKFEGALDQMIKLMVDMKESLHDDSQPATNPQPQSQPQPQVKAASVDDDLDSFDKLRSALQSDKWPEAVNPNLICDPNSVEDKRERGRGVIELMIEEDLKDLRVLDFGCGEGHCIQVSSEYSTAMSAGYDIKEYPSWGSFEQKPNLMLSTKWEDIKQNGPYNIVIVFDVIDHIKGQTPLQVLQNIKEVLADEGKIYMRCHPHVSRHATHAYHDLNKAFIHLVFTETEMKELIPNSEYVEESIGVIYPLKTYGEYIDQAGLKVINRRDIVEKVEPFFKIPKIAQRIMQNTGHSAFPEFQMGLQFIDYVLGK